MNALLVGMSFPPSGTFNLRGVVGYLVLFSLRRPVWHGSGVGAWVGH